MRPLVVTLLLFGLCLAGFLWFREHVRAERDAATAVVQVEPAASARSLEERAAAAQGTTLPPQAAPPDPQPVSRESFERVNSAEAAGRYQCDGRIYCSQMHSCEEAKWFLEHCPGTRMDGDRHGNGERGDGVPCERQWCKDPFSR